MASTLISTLFIILISFLPVITHSLPFVVFHGVADDCAHKGVQRFTKLLSKWSKSQGYCIEIGDGVMDSWFMPFSEQTRIACEKVKSMSELREGFNIVGLSQGNLVGRGVVELCDEAPHVTNFISVSGPHAGIASVPFCGSGIFCIMVDSIMQLAVYSDFVQEHLGPADYIKIPTDLDQYKEGCTFLPKINNEFSKNATYKERFSRLENLVLIMCEKDTVLVPKETSWFGYYPDGAWEPLLTPQETRLYKEDWIGLKKLDEAGKVKFIKLPGIHMEVSCDEMRKYIVPYLEDQSSSPSLSSSKNSNITESSSRPQKVSNFVRYSSRKEDLSTQPSSAWSSFKKLTGRSDEYRESLQLKIRD